MKAYRRVLVATDLSPASRATIGAVEAIAGKGTLVVHVVHVLEPIAYALTAPLMLEHDRARREEIRLELARLSVALQKRVDGVRVRTHVIGGSAPDEICRLAEAVRAHLVIVGSHGRRGFRRAIIGSVAERVARYAGRPVLIVPGAGAHRRPRR